MAEHPVHTRQVVGSSPTSATISWPVGQAVKTPPFHGGNRSSILLRVTKKIRELCSRIFLSKPTFQGPQSEQSELWVKSRLGMAPSICGGMKSYGKARLKSLAFLADSGICPISRSGCPRAMLAPDASVGKTEIQPQVELSQ